MSNAVPFPAETLARTPSGTRATTFGIHCFEQKFEGEESRPPVNLVVFDCDETLTLSTFMPKERGFERTIGWSSWPEYISMVNFGSPFIEENNDFQAPFGEGSRLTQLQDLFCNLRRGNGEHVRTLAVLTRNSRGAVACLNLLLMAKLAEYFSVIWSMAANPGMPNGVYREGATWKTFRAPLSAIYDHKADVLDSITKAPADWFPQLMTEESGGYSHLLDLKLEGIVLVDDVRTNFQSPSANGPKVHRYCKVARYDGKHPHMGFLTDMGGIGAKRSDDYAELLEFVQEPWKFKAEPHLVCMERQYEGCEDFGIPSLLVFEFDETLSLCTFIPEETGFMKQIGYSCANAEEKEHLVLYNFESPYNPGSRVDKLCALLKDLSMSEHGQARSLAILTENEAGAVAVLNLLLLADLADNFCAIWAPMAEEGLPKGAYRSSEGWEEFALPAEGIRDHNSKADLLRSIVARPHEWFPQAFDSAGAVREGLEHLAPENLRLESIVLIDDERTKFHTSSGDNPQVLRYCKVARYDDIYRDQGLVMHMGGIGARTDKDYKNMRHFMDRPWKFRVAADPELCRSRAPSELEHVPDAEDLLEHSVPELELPRPSSCRRRGLTRARTAPPGDLSKLQDQVVMGLQSSSSSDLAGIP